MVIVCDPLDVHGSPQGEAVGTDGHEVGVSGQILLRADLSHSEAKLLAIDTDRLRFIEQSPLQSLYQRSLLLVARLVD